MKSYWVILVVNNIVVRVFGDTIGVVILDEYLAYVENTITELDEFNLCQEVTSFLVCVMKG